MTDGSRSISRREIIRRGAIASGVVWTTPLVLQSVAGAQAACSPVTCSTYYIAKFDGTDPGCNPSPGPCDDSDPPCAFLIPPVTLNDGCAAGANGVTVSCPGGPGGQYVVALNNPTFCHFVKVWYKKGSSGGQGNGCFLVFDETTGGQCTTQVTIPEPDPSHITAVWCCA